MAIFVFATQANKSNADMVVTYENPVTLPSEGVPTLSTHSSPSYAPARGGGGGVLPRRAGGQQQQPAERACAHVYTWPDTRVRMVWL